MSEMVEETQFKDSPVGKIPVGWETFSLESVTTLMTNGFVGTATPYYVPEGVTYLRSLNIRSNYIDTENVIYVSEDFHLKNERSILKKGDLLTVQSGHIGTSSVVPESLENTNCHALILSRFHKDQVQPEFASQYLNSDLGKTRLRQIFVGSTIQHINTKDLKKFNIPIPPLAEQQKVASILTSVDQVIEKTESEISKLQDLKKGMMQQLLTQGIGHTQFKDSPVGRIPVRWEVKKLKNIFTFGGGSTPSRKESKYFCQKDSGYIWVKTTDLNDSYIFDSEEHISEMGFSNSSCKIHPYGTVVVAMYGGWNQIGRSGLLMRDAAVNQAITAILPTASVSSHYLNYWLVGKRFLWKQIAASSRKDPNISKVDVENFPICIPPPDEQQKIASILTSIDDSIQQQQRELQQTQNLKKSLMQDLLTGKVRVKVD